MSWPLTLRDLEENVDMHMDRTVNRIRKLLRRNSRRMLLASSLILAFYLGNAVATRLWATWVATGIFTGVAVFWAWDLYAQIKREEAEFVKMLDQTRDEILRRGGGLL